MSPPRTFGKRLVFQMSPYRQPCPPSSGKVHVLEQARAYPVKCEYDRHIRMHSEELHLLECDTKVDVDNFSRAVVHENIGSMPVPKAKDVTHDRRGRHTTSILQTHCKPRHRVPMFLCKVMAHDRLEIFSNFEECFLLQFSLFCCLSCLQLR